MAFRISGISTVSRNLNREVREIQGRTAKGVLAAAIFVKGESQEKTPQKKGVLINSAFTRLGTFAGMPVATVGYTAKYAAAVHEMPASNNFTKAGTGPKFLENAVFNNMGMILTIIKNRAKI